MSDKYKKLQNYKKALAKLDEGIKRYDEKDDMYRDGLIQRFEFTFELAWKTLKSIFEEEGLIALNSPKTVLREAYAAGLIDDEELWLNMLRDRNLTVHIYDEKMSIEICKNIVNRYADEFHKLLRAMETR
ncbi:MAG TPA: nucleotidyltransferase [Clostridiales bacterium]|nr:nucleotidyltransferase [Clostridiales bacterium]